MVQTLFRLNPSPTIAVFILQVQHQVPTEPWGKETQVRVEDMQDGWEPELTQYRNRVRLTIFTRLFCPAATSSRSRANLYEEPFDPYCGDPYLDRNGDALLEYMEDIGPADIDGAHALLTTEFSSVMHRRIRGDINSLPGVFTWWRLEALCLKRRRPREFDFSWVWFGEDIFVTANSKFTKKVMPHAQIVCVVTVESDVPGYEAQEMVIGHRRAEGPAEGHFHPRVQQTPAIQAAFSLLARTEREGRHVRLSNPVVFCEPPKMSPELFAFVMGLEGLQPDKVTLAHYVVPKDYTAALEQFRGHLSLVDCELHEDGQSIVRAVQEEGDGPFALSCSGGTNFRQTDVAELFSGTRLAVQSFEVVCYTGPDGYNLPEEEMVFSDEDEDEEEEDEDKEDEDEEDEAEEEEPPSAAGPAPGGDSSSGDSNSGGAISAGAGGVTHNQQASTGTRQIGDLYLLAPDSRNLTEEEWWDGLDMITGGAITARRQRQRLAEQAGEEPTGWNVNSVYYSAETVRCQEQYLASIRGRQASAETVRRQHQLLASIRGRQAGEEPAHEEPTGETAQEKENRRPG